MSKKISRAYALRKKNNKLIKKKYPMLGFSKSAKIVE
jgi:hypothetical protein